MTIKHSIKDIREALGAQKESYQGLARGLQEERLLAQAEAQTARQNLEPVLAGFVSRLVSDLEAPALAQFDELLASHNHPRRPGLTKYQLEQQNAKATAELAKLTAKHGPLDAVKARFSEQEGTIAASAWALEATTQQRKTNDKTLLMLDVLNDKLEADGHSSITAATLANYTRPPTLLGQLGRWLSHSAYRKARPELDAYAVRGIDLAAELTKRDELAAQADQQSAARQQAYAALTLTGQTVVAFEQQQALQRSPKEILSEVRTVITDALLDRATFIGAREMFAGQLPAEAEGLSLRAELFGKLADNIVQQHMEAAGVSEQLDDPLKKLDKAIRNRQGSKEIDFPLGKQVAKMQRHQTLLGQRLSAARDIRSASHSTSATSSSHDSSNFLLWYLILSDTGPAQAAAPAFQSGSGGDFGGGGAGGSWDEPVAANSYFRAEMLGISPATAMAHGLDAGLLRIDAATQRDLGIGNSISINSSDLGGASLGDDSRSLSTLGAGIGLGVAGSTTFNELGSMDLDLRRMDLGGISQEISSSVSSISSDIGSSSGWMYDGSGSSSSSSFSCDSGGGGGGGGDGGC
jgi:uncharacterized membrane protein YgcG